MKFLERMNRMGVVQLTMLKREQEDAISDYKRSLTVLPSTRDTLSSVTVLKRLNDRLDEINSTIGRKSLATTP